MSDAIHARRPLTGVPQLRRCHPLWIAEKPAEPLSLRLICKRLAQSFRLMVGVQDYQNYLRHMQAQHPLTAAMSEREFHRYCLEARYPSKGGKLGKCPC
ncbi:CstA-like transporter-associated (seleno)protein [Erwiniaceae bacterium BAC15a-03b]|uniref:CstA-like transporter-associated (Seleno)protein n=1 Tax=Winslowiella arboricola TaxID=2978220 RepID=A0A9J6PPV2_9GAMM|nr:CstA-like transporter-associated (seleno)protein [Winslowiella arboricola]MCU5775683.1 CstA-like transporter-associated (seleno)protein [Winslowiella arboricola]MCU5779466.1 CstA-like transporter-associated (seleno)protein [Winslowiella arboricola]